jgi:hypothetical protein
MIFSKAAAKIAQVLKDLEFPPDMSSSSYFRASSVGLCFSL